MPQMAPLNWLMLMFYFIMIFLTFNIFNYYLWNPKYSSTNNFKKKMNFNWKW
nr:ATP synthase F0 subunit 8 [Acanthocinus griseus]